IDGVGTMPWPHKFTFTLTQLGIRTLRSAHSDTDFVTVSGAAGHAPAINVERDLGDVGTGFIPLNMAVGPLIVQDTEDGVAFNYIVVNSGHASPDETRDALKTASTDLAERGASAATEAAAEEIGASIGSEIVPLIGTALGLVAGWFAGKA